MENTILETRAISKRYGQVNALEDINISIGQGRIYGLIGENGAGKSTLLRIITGLAMPSSGEIYMFGKTGESNLNTARRRLGSIVEEPALYPDYTAEENLELQRILVGNPDRGVVDQCLRVMGLADSETKKVKAFSMGMKQRLGIASSLVGNPHLLILDEPINGLDPKGIAELRGILHKLNTEKSITILVSSHILNELYLLATDFIIIHQGRIIETLTHMALEEKTKKYIAIKVDQVSLALTVIEQELHTKSFKVMEDQTIRLFDYTRDVTVVAEALKKYNILVTQIALFQQTLEEYYLSVTGGGSHA